MNATLDDDTCFSGVFMGCLSTTLMIRPDNAEEMKTGNSFANPANANFAMQLVVRLHRDAALVDAHDFPKCASVPIPTPYKEQKHLYDLLLRQLTKGRSPSGSG
ncbi:MFS monocarboxylate transporter [Fusarium coicis]|nr:MFS monocarboxylate transporter [Fusarium coicis]